MIFGGAAETTNNHEEMKRNININLELCSCQVFILSLSVLVSKYLGAYSGNSKTAFQTNFMPPKEASSSMYLTADLSLCGLHTTLMSECVCALL